MLIELFLRLFNVSVPGLAGNVDLKDSRMKGLFISRTKLCSWRQNEKWNMLYHVKAIKILRRTSLRPRNFLQPGILVVVNKSSYGKLYWFRNSFGFWELPAKVKYQFSYSSCFWQLFAQFLTIFKLFQQSIKHIWFAESSCYFKICKLLE